MQSEENKKEMECCNMAKSKLVKANQKIADKVVGGYKKIENGAVGGYKKMEESVVGKYKEIEDFFVDQFLTKDGETVEEAKMRLKEEQEQRREQREKNIKEAGHHYEK